MISRGSPLTYVTGTAPPFFIVHGSRDRFVALPQSVELDERLRAAGAVSHLLVVTNLDHGFILRGQVTHPGRGQVTLRVADFFDGVLRR